MANLSFVKPRADYTYTGVINAAYVRVDEKSHGGITFELEGFAPHGFSKHVMFNSGLYTIPNGTSVLAFKWWKSVNPKRSQEPIIIRLKNVVGANVAEDEFLEVNLYRKGARPTEIG